jgi:hypothetical protein
MLWAFPGKARPDGMVFDLPIGGGPTAAPDEDPAPPIEESDEPQFYDERIPDRTQSVIYVIDRSASMALPTQPFIDNEGRVVQDGSRLDYVKSELKRSVASLPEQFTFNMIIYCECVETWKPARVAATPRAKAEAMAWIERIEPWGWTNTGGATAKALSDRGNRAILLLSDGAPNFLDCSQTFVADFETHRRVIKESNRQEAIVHTFGIGLDPETRQFMAEVARDSGGTFREID